MWANCGAYNAEGSDIMRICKRLEKLLLAAWKDADLPRKHPQPAADADGSQAGPSAVPAPESARRKGRKGAEAALAVGRPSPSTAWCAKGETGAVLSSEQHLCQ